MSVLHGPENGGRRSQDLLKAFKQTISLSYFMGTASVTVIIWSCNAQAIQEQNLFKQTFFYRGGLGQVQNVAQNKQMAGPEFDQGKYILLGKISK